MKKELLFVGIMSLGLFVSSCKDDDSDFIKKSDISSSGGYIKANIVGVSSDGVSINESFTADKYNIQPDKEANYRVSGNSLIFEVRRKEDPIVSNNYIDMNFTKSGDSISGINFYIEYEKLTANNQVLSLNLDYSTSSAITNLTFDQGSGVLTGKYSIKYSSIGSDNIPRTINVTGDFNVTVTKVIGNIN